MKNLSLTLYFILSPYCMPLSLSQRSTKNRCLSFICDMCSPHLLFRIVCGGGGVFSKCSLDILSVELSAH